MNETCSKWDNEFGGQFPWEIVDLEFFQNFIIYYLFLIFLVFLSYFPFYFTYLYLLKKL